MGAQRWGAAAGHFILPTILTTLPLHWHVQVTFKRGIAPEKGLRPDTKVHCHSCGKMRSFTLIAADGRCGLCHAKVPSAPETAADNASYWCECRACHAHYAVAEPALLKQRAKVRAAQSAAALSSTCARRASLLFTIRYVLSVSASATSAASRAARRPSPRRRRCRIRPRCRASSAATTSSV